MFVFEKIEYSAQPHTAQVSDGANSVTRHVAVNWVDSSSPRLAV